MTKAVKLLRRLLRRLSLALVVFTLGVAAATAAFSVFHSLLISALPYPNSDQIVKLSSVNEVTGESEGLAPADFVEVRDNIEAFEGVAGYIGFERTLYGLGEPEFVQGIAGSGGLFAVLGQEPLHGRIFTKEDDNVNAQSVIVISHDLWSSRFGGQASAIGKAVRLNDKLYTVIGVMPAGFSFPGAVDFWTPLVPHSPRLLGLRGFRILDVSALLPPGEDLASAQAQLDVLSSRLQKAYPKSNQHWTLRATSLRESLVGELRPYLWALLSASVVLLAIGCANVTTLFLARSAERAPEVAIRLSLGASLGRVFSRFLIEGLLFSLIGGLMGGVLALAILNTFEKILATHAGSIPIQVNLIAWLFALGLCGLSGILFGLVPAWQFSRLDLNQTLRSETPSSLRRSRDWLRPGLVVAQVALAVTLCVAGGLLAFTFSRLASVEPGFDPDQVMTLEFKLGRARYQTVASIADFQHRLLERTSALGGVAHVGLSNFLPLEGLGFTKISIPESDGQEAREVEIGYRMVDGGFFRALRIPLVAGRLFSQLDTADSPPVAIANQAAVRLLWSGEDSVGKTIALDGDREVVGVVGSVRSAGLSQEPPAEFYLPSSQGAGRRIFLIIRSGRPLGELVRDVRGVVRSIDAQLPVGRIRSMASLVAGTVFDRWSRALVFSFLALLALLLTVVGLYGLVVTTTRQRTHELGVRMALGATRIHVLGMILKQMSLLIASGLLIGLALSAASAHLLQALLYGVSPLEPKIYLLVAALVIWVALVACCIPVLEAARKDPLRSLRCE